jgi:hypothetical protein
MAQSPFLADQLQIEPGSAGTRLINGNVDGELQFQDSEVSAVLLKALVGTRNITGVFVVGRAGDGAAYTSVQDAFDAIPNSSSSSAPSLVLIYPGVYSENLTLQKDGVFIQGVGGVTLQNVGANDTLEISASLGAVPQSVKIQGLTIKNTDAAQTCVRVLGADSFATGTIDVDTAPLTAGDEIVIGGVTLTGIAGTRTSGADNFNVLGSTQAAVAAEITAALNDPGNSFSTTVRASILGVRVTTDAQTAGSGGNAITLTTTSANLTLSGGTLTGGGAAGSLVASEGLEIASCKLVAEGAGSYQIRANTCGVIEVRGGSWRGSDNASLSTVANCARLRVLDLEWANDIELAYDTGNDRPGDPTSEYRVVRVDRLNEVTANLVGEGTLIIDGCREFITGLGQAGDRTLEVRGSNLGVVVLDGTTVATLSKSVRTSATVGAGSPTLAESTILDNLTYSNPNISEAYTFDVPQPDANYTVALESPTTGAVLAVTNKAVTGFDVESSLTFDGTVSVLISRNL